MPKITVSILQSKGLEWFIESKPVGGGALNFLNEYTACAYIKYVVMWNDKNGSKCGRFSEEYPTCGRFYKTI